MNIIFQEFSQEHHCTSALTALAKLQQVCLIKNLQLYKISNKIFVHYRQCGTRNMNFSDSVCIDIIKIEIINSFIYSSLLQTTMNKCQMTMVTKSTAGTTHVVDKESHHLLKMSWKKQDQQHGTFV